jgi:hypothetical protein
MKSFIVDLLRGEGGLLRARGVLALLFSGTTCYLWATGDPVPAELIAINATVVGVYFGARIASGPNP